MYGFKLKESEDKQSTIIELYQHNANTEKDKCIQFMLIYEVKLEEVKKDIEKYKTEFIKKITDNLNNAVIFETTIKDYILQK